MKTTPSQPPRYFPIEVAAQLVGVKPAVLTYWQRHGFLKPAVPAHGVGPKTSGTTASPSSSPSASCRT